MQVASRLFIDEVNVRPEFTYAGIPGDLCPVSTDLTDDLPRLAINYVSWRVAHWIRSD